MGSGQFFFKLNQKSNTLHTFGEKAKCPSITILVKMPCVFYASSINYLYQIEPYKCQREVRNFNGASACISIHSSVRKAMSSKKKDSLSIVNTFMRRRFLLLTFAAVVIICFQ